MRKFSEVATGAVNALAEARERSPESTALALPSRPEPLSSDDFRKLEAALDAAYTREEITEGYNRPVKDDLGHTYRWEFDTRVIGERFVRKAEASQRLIDAILRPATPLHIVVHLTRLGAHLRWTKGEGAFQAVVEDMARMLEGVSEWAVVKACESLMQAGSPFFPDTPALLAAVRRWNDTAATIAGAQLPTPKAEQSDDWLPPADAPKPRAQRALRKPTAEEKARVRKMLCEAGIYSAEECEA